jgi:hypothetical protein
LRKSKILNYLLELNLETKCLSSNFLWRFPSNLCFKYFYQINWQQYCRFHPQLKGHGNETDFLGFLQKLVPHESLTLPFGPIRFWLRIRGDIRIGKTTPRYHRYGELPTLRIDHTGSHWLPVSLSRGVDNSQHHWYAEWATPCITDTESQLLNFLKRKLSVSMIRRVVDSPHQWYDESPTPVSLSRRVADSAYHRYGESKTPRIVESGSRRLRVSVIRGVGIREKKISLASFSVL